MPGLLVYRVTFSRHKALFPPPSGNAIVRKIERDAAGKVVAADCHGPIGLVECVKPDGTPLVAGLCVTAFSDAEEAAVGQTDNVPFLLEAKFKALGGLYQPGADWHANVAVAGKLVTGQNPQSSDACAAAVVKLLAP